MSISRNSCAGIAVNPRNLRTNSGRWSPRFGNLGEQDRIGKRYHRRVRHTPNFSHACFRRFWDSTTINAMYPLSVFWYNYPEAYTSSWMYEPWCFETFPSLETSVFWTRELPSFSEYVANSAFHGYRQWSRDTSTRRTDQAHMDRTSSPRTLPFASPMTTERQRSSKSLPEDANSTSADKPIPPASTEASSLPSDIQASYSAKFLDLFKCPVCHDYMAQKFMVCANGHPLCYPCIQRVSKCPVCRDNCPFSPVRLLEQVAEHSPFPCRHADRGCPEFPQANGWFEHVETCSHSPPSLSPKY